VTATMVAIQAGFGTAVAVAAIGLGRAPDPLASSGIVRGGPPAIGDVLEIVGASLSPPSFRPPYRTLLLFAFASAHDGSRSSPVAGSISIWNVSLVSARRSSTATRSASA
jgi:hypothetical protein